MAVSFALQLPVFDHQMGQAGTGFLQSRGRRIDQPRLFPQPQQRQIVQAVAKRQLDIESTDLRQQLVLTVAIETGHQTAKTVVHLRANNPVG